MSRFHAHHVTCALTLVLGFAIAACTPRQETLSEDVAGSGPPPADTMVADQWTRDAVGTKQTDRTLVALGNEPFWNVRVTWREILWTDPEHLDGYRFEPADAVREGDALVYRTRRDVPAGERGPNTLELRIRQGTCSDGMSDRQYAMTAEARLDSVEYRGCAHYPADAQPSER
jgi:uncharacterized membrane protein